MHSEFQETMRATQRDLCEVFAASLSSSRLDGGDTARAYVQAYEAEFAEALADRGLLTPITLEALSDALSQATVVLIADYHTLRQAQQAQLALLKRLVERRRRVIVGFEMFREIHQDVLDRFMDRRISRADTFLSRINYAETWGFEWENYRPLVDFCREHRLRAVALNSKPAATRGAQHPLFRRDQQAAHVIAHELSLQKGALLVACFGDWHLAAPHLPRAITLATRERGLEARVAVVFQNAEALYWPLAAEGLLSQAAAFQMGPDRAVLFNATPVAKLHSALLWESNAWLLRERLEHSLGRLDSVPDEVEHVACQVYDALRRLFGVRSPAFDATLHFGADRRFLSGLRDTAHWRWLLERIKGRYFPQKQVIHLSDANLDVISETVTHYLRDLLVRRTAARRDDEDLSIPGNPADRFYLKALAYAIGWIGSRFINPQRDPYDAARLRELLDDYHAVMDKSAPFTWLADGAHGYFRHREILSETLAALEQHPRQRDRALVELGARPLFKIPRGIAESVARLVGYELGDALWRALVNAPSKSRRRSLLLLCRELLSRPVYKRLQARRWYAELAERFLR